MGFFSANINAEAMTFEKNSQVHISIGMMWMEEFTIFMPLEKDGGMLF